MQGHAWAIVSAGLGKGAQGRSCASGGGGWTSRVVWLCVDTGIGRGSKAGDGSMGVSSNSSGTCGYQVAELPGG
jgi:hypothetical protein